jgi:hypothetical protein
MAPPLEQWEYGKALRRVGCDESGWSLKGEWEPVRRGGRARGSNTAGAEAVFAFEGTGVEIVGMYVPDGGFADVYLDGELKRTTDCFLDYAWNENDRRDEEDVWHAFDLPRGKHTVRIVVRGEPFKGSSGSWVILTEAVVFDDGA